jgi:hypothetical protein
MKKIQDMLVKVSRNSWVEIDSQMSADEKLHTLDAAAS